MLYSELCEVYDSLEKTTKRLEKTELLSNFLSKLKKEKDKKILYLLQGKVFPDYDERELGISEQLVIKALAKAAGSSSDEIIQEWKKSGDLGEIAEKLISKKRQSTLFSKKLTTEKVLENLRKLVEFTGQGTIDKKIGLISELLTSASPIESKFIIRTLLQDLRVGLGTGVLRDSIVWACFGKENKEAYEKVQETYDKTTDFALVFENSCKNIAALDETPLNPGNPVKVMLYPKAKNIQEGFEVVGKPALIDYKYDGFRMLINKDETGTVKIFTRRLDNVTNQFPEVKDYVKKYVNGDTFILDSEAVGYDPLSLKYKPFQDISQRIRRKYDIEKLVKDLPIELNVFDILYYNGKNLLKTPFIERRKLIEKIIKNIPGKVRVSKAIITDSEKEAELFYKEALSNKEEGIMMKNLQAPYRPGARVGFGVKVKPQANDLDLVIIKAESGTGKRAGWLTSYTVACRTESGELLEIGKVSTGLKEKEEQGTSFIELTNLLKPLIQKEQGREVTVKPKIIVSVSYQEIQKSPSYSSGYALRFPRFTALRPDRSLNDIASLDEVEKEYISQR